MGNDDAHERLILGKAIKTRVVRLSSGGKTGGPDSIALFSPQNRYEVVEHIGKGGMGTVVEVTDKNVFRHVAMKVLLEHQGEYSEPDIVRFVQEARITANLEHPNIVPIHEIGVSGEGHPYYTMKLVRGETLSDVIARLADGRPAYTPKYTLTDLIQIFLKICDGVSYAHAKEIVHLDLKPSNIRIGEFGEVLVMDWGLSTYVGTDPLKAEWASDTAARLQDAADSMVEGSPGYMAPEQVSGTVKDWDARTDVYALGGILYKILTLCRPIDDENVMEVFRKTVEGEIVPPGDRCPNRFIPSDLSAIAMKALALKKEDRYQSVSGLQEDIHRYLEGNAITAQRDTLRRKLKRTYTKHAKVYQFSALLLLFLALGVVFGSIQYMRSTAGWIKALDRDLSDAAATSHAFQFLDHEFNEVELPVENATADGMLIPSRHWLWLRNSAFYNDIRIVIDLSWDDAGRVDALEVCFNSEQKLPEPGWWMVPTGYSAQIGGWKGRINFLSLNHAPGPPDLSNSTRFEPAQSGHYRAVLERRGEELSLSLNGQRLVTDLDPLPLTGAPYGAIGLRSWSTCLRVRRVTVYTRKLPQYSTPIEVGNAFAGKGMFEEALHEYLKVKDNYTNARLREKALIKAIIASRKLSRAKLGAQLADEFREQFPKSRYMPLLLKGEILDKWRNKEFAMALLLLDRVEPPPERGRIALTVLKERKGAMPPDIAGRLLHAVAMKRDVQSLEVTNCGLRDLTPLRPLHLRVLKCGENDLVSLEPLRGMPLDIVVCNRNRISDLSPLADSPVIYLNAAANPIDQLPDFRHRTLDNVNLQGTNITSIAPLTEQPVRELNVSDTPLTSLVPLKGSSSLRTIFFAGTNVTDPSPLADLQLDTVSAGRAYGGGRGELRNLEFLRDSPVSRVTVRHSSIDSADALVTCLNLTEIALEDNRITDLSFLKPFAEMGRPLDVDISRNPISDTPILRKLELKSITCDDTNITDLSFLYDREFRSFPHFMNPRLKRDQILALAERWRGTQGMGRLADHAETLVWAFFDKDVRALKAKAKRIEGHRYLILHRRLLADDAANVAEEFGGHLATFETEEEFRAVLPYLVQNVHDVWVGLRHDRDKKLHWVTGRSVYWDLPRGGAVQERDSDWYSFTVRGGRIFGNSGAEVTRPVFVEWDD